MKKLSLLLVCILGISFASFSQDDDYDSEPFETNEEFVGYDKKNKKERKNLENMRIGGNLNFGFGNNQLLFSISPTVAYQIVPDRLEFGAGFIYEYYSITNQNYKVNVVGPNGYLRAYLWEGLFLQTRGTWQKFYINNNGFKDDLFFSNVFAGGGYQFEIGENLVMNTGLEINLIEYDEKFVGNSRQRRLIQPFFQVMYRF